MKPFLRYVGSKRRMLKHIRPLLPSFEYYHEPFVGGGSLFFDLEPKCGFINDTDKRLIRVYKTIRNHPKEVCVVLSTLQKHQDKESYYSIREKFHDRLGDIAFAAFYIYFNKVSFGALMRFNKNNRFNVPYGRAYKKIFKKEHILSVSKLLQRTAISNNDIANYCYAYIKDNAKDLNGHLFYLDPPYVGTVSTDIAYQGVFTEKKMKEVAIIAKRLAENGANVMVSYNESIRKYMPDFHCIEYGIKYSVNNSIKKDCKELIFLKGDFNV